ncbi:winged helix-turn-helix transcriptional regulator [archaeon]|nr:MAG: winged helix-turn-helix transcriptional regulator [archaeon]
MKRMSQTKLVLMLMLSTSLFVSAAWGQDYSPETLILDVFSDGSVNVEYVVEPETTLARVNVTLPGEPYLDLLVVDPDGIILDWDPIDGGVEVDSLGANEITISYSTQSLTNKTGSIWVVSVSSQITGIITLQRGAVLVGRSPTPSGITIVDGKASITMPHGTSSVSYMIGTTGTREHALVLLNNAEKTVNEVSLKGVMVDAAEEILGRAREAYTDRLYSQSEQLSLQAVEAARETEAAADEAMNAVEEAEDLIETKAGQVSAEALTQANQLLDEAIDAYEGGEYEVSLTKAEQAYEEALNAEPETGGNQTLLILGVAVVVLLVAGYMYLSSRQRGLPAKPEAQAPEVDLDAVFRDRPHLRTDDKAVLRYVQESGGTFITEVRERFDIPKSSAWRMIKRLEAEGLLEVSTVGRETYLQLKDQEGKR